MAIATKNARGNDKIIFLAFLSDPVDPMNRRRPPEDDFTEAVTASPDQSDIVLR